MKLTVKMKSDHNDNLQDNNIVSGTNDFKWAFMNQSKLKILVKI